MKKVWAKLFVVCMAAMLAVGVCFAFTACDEGEVPTSKKYTYDSCKLMADGEEVGDGSMGDMYDQLYAGSTAYFENGKFVWETMGTKQLMDYTEEDGVYYLTAGKEFEEILGIGAEISVTFDDTTLTLISQTTSSSAGGTVTATLNILFKA